MPSRSRTRRLRLRLSRNRSHSRGQSYRRAETPPGTKLSFLAYVRRSTEPAAKTVLYQDTVAVTGVLVAAAGVGLHQLTGNVAWDAAAAIVVGLILVFVAVMLGRNFRALLIGAGAPPDERERLRDVLRGHAEVNDVLDLRTMYVGPRALLVAARIDLEPGRPAGNDGRWRRRGVGIRIAGRHHDRRRHLARDRAPRRAGSS